MILESIAVLTLLVCGELVVRFTPPSLLLNSKSFKDFTLVPTFYMSVARLC